MTTKGIKTAAVIVLLIANFGWIAVAQTCAPASTGLVSWYAADNNALDSRSRNNGSLEGVAFAAGQNGQAFNLLNQQASVAIPNRPELFPSNALTIEAWVNPSTYASCNGNQYRIFHTVRTVLRGYVTFLECSTQRFVGQIFDSSGNANTIASTAGAIFPQGTFTHFAMSWDGTHLRLYVNGVLDNTVATTISSIGTSPDSLRIGNETDFGFRGQIDELAFYNRALTATEIAAIHAAGTAGKCKPTATVAPSGQVAWLTGDGNANDIAGTSNGALQSGASFKVGRIGQAFSIGGGFSGDNIRIDSTGLFRNISNATIEAWIFPRGSGSIGGNSIFFEDVGINPGARFQVLRNSNGSIQIFGRDATGAIFSSTTPAGAAPLNSWTHFTGVYETGVGVKIFINGILAATLNNAALTNLSADNAQRVRIGAAGSTDSVFGEFNGDVDEFSIYNSAVTEAEIASIFNAGIAGKLKQNATVDQNSLVSLWQGEGNANDTRGANNGTFASNTFAAGKVGQAFNLDGTDDSVNLGSLPPMQNFSFEAWVRPQSAVNDPINQELIVGQASFGGQIAVRPGTNGGMRVVVQYRDTANSFAKLLSTVDIPLNSWSHLNGTYDGATLKLYINGVLNTQANPANTTVQTCNTPYFIGGFQSVTDCNGATNQPFQFFNGLIDEAAVYNRALTAAEVRANYEAGNALSTVVGDARVTFPTVTTAGTTQQIPLNTTLFPALPLGTHTGLAYDIATDAVFTGNPSVCFNLTAFTSAEFSNLRVMHFEAGNWVNVTASANTFPTLCTVPVNSFSPFAIAVFVPSAASVSVGGRVVTADGRGITKTRVSITGPDGITRTVLTGSFGYYRFSSVQVGETYTISVSSKGYQFANPTQVVNVTDELTGVDFTASGVSKNRVERGAAWYNAKSK